MIPQTVAADDMPLYRLDKAVAAFGGKPDVVHTWIYRYRFLENLSAGYVRRAGKVRRSGRGSFEPTMLALEPIR